MENFPYFKQISGSSTKYKKYCRDSSQFNQQDKTLNTFAIKPCADNTFSTFMRINKSFHPLFGC